MSPPDSPYLRIDKRFPVGFAGEGHLLVRNRDWLIRIDLAEQRMGPTEPLVKPGFQANTPLRIPSERGVRALSPGGRYLVTRDADGKSLHVLDIAAWETVADIPLPEGFVMFWGEVGFSPDGSRLAYAVRHGKDGALVNEVDVATGRLLSSVPWSVPDPPRTSATTWHHQNPLNGLSYFLRRGSFQPAGGFWSGTAEAAGWNDR